MIRYCLLLLGCLLCTQVHAGQRVRASCGVHQQAYAVNQFQALPLLQPIYQVGAGLKQEAVEEHGFRQSSGSVKRLLELEAYYAAMQDVKFMMQAQYGPPEGQAEQTQVTLEQRYPVFAAKCLSCHDSPESQGGLLIEGELSPDAAEFFVERVRKGEMPPKKPLTPMEYDAFKFEMLGEQQQVTHQVEVQQQPAQECNSCQQPAPTEDRWSAPVTPPPAPAAKAPTKEWGYMGENQLGYKADSNKPVPPGNGESWTREDGKVWDGKKWFKPDHGTPTLGLRPVGTKGLWNDGVPYNDDVSIKIQKWEHEQYLKDSGQWVEPKAPEPVPPAAPEASKWKLLKSMFVSS